MFESEEKSVNSLEKVAYKSLQGSLAPKRSQAIIWKMMKQRLPTKDNMMKRGHVSPLFRL